MKVSIPPHRPARLFRLPLFVQPRLRAFVARLTGRQSRTSLPLTADGAQAGAEAQLADAERDGDHDAVNRLRIVLRGSCCE